MQKSSSQRDVNEHGVVVWSRKLAASFVLAIVFGYLAYSAAGFAGGTVKIPGTGLYLVYVKPSVSGLEAEGVVLHEAGHILDLHNRRRATILGSLVGPDSLAYENEVYPYCMTALALAMGGTDIHEAIEVSGDVIWRVHGPTTTDSMLMRESFTDRCRTVLRPLYATFPQLAADLEEEGSSAPRH